MYILKYININKLNRNGKCELLFNSSIKPSVSSAGESDALPEKYCYY